MCLYTSVGVWVCVIYCTSVGVCVQVVCVHFVYEYAVDYVMCLCGVCVCMWYVCVCGELCKCLCVSGVFVCESVCQCFWV